MRSDKFLMTIGPTADEIVGATLHVQPRVAEAEELTEAINEALKTLPEIKARIWKGHTNEGYPVEVAVLRFVRMEPEEQERLDNLIKTTTLPTELPDPGVGRGKPKREG